jgi:hypothetical protein
VAGEITEAYFLDYLTKGVIIFGDRIGFDADSFDFCLSIAGLVRAGVIPNIYGVTNP